MILKKSYNGSYTHDNNETLKQRELSSAQLAVLTR